MIKFVKLVEVYPAGVTTKTFTHEIINDDSVIEVYTEDANIYPIATTQSGNTVTISIVDHDEPVEVCVTINNMVSYSEPLYTSDILVPSPIEDYPLDVELFNIKGELQSIPFEYVGNEAFEALQTEVNGKAPQTEVSAIKESLIQFKDDGFLPKNLFNPSNVLNANISTEPSIISSDRTRLVYAKCEPNKTYTVSKMVGARFQVAYTKALPSVGVNFFGKVTQNNASSITITTGADAEYIVAFVYSSSSGDSMSAETMLASVQIEEGTEATQYVPYAESNTGLTQITEELKQSLSQLDASLTTLTTLSLANGAEFETYASTVYKRDAVRLGRLLIVQIAFELKTGQYDSNWHKVFKLPNNIKPAVVPSCDFTTKQGKVGFLRVSLDGDVEINMYGTNIDSENLINTMILTIV